MSLRAGDEVEVRSREEILATLDAKGCLDELPFMPEMLNYCGRKLRVVSSAHKTCDPAYKTGGRSMKAAVHLEGVRCDGSAHGGCEAGCLIFWKHEWLRQPGEAARDTPAGSMTEDELAATARTDDGADRPTYRCQATELHKATDVLSPWDLRQYVTDLRSGNTTLGRLAGVTCFSLFSQLLRLGIGHRLLIGLYDAFQRIIGGQPYPLVEGSIPRGQPTPTEHLNLQAGETVRVKSREEIFRTLDTSSKNRGLWFDAEMTPFCGGTYRVHHRVNRLLDERTGEMLEMQNPCIVLDNVYCQSAYSTGRLLCPRAIYSYWRECWLERAPQNVSSQSDNES